MEEEFDQLTALFEGSGLPSLEIQYLIADVARIIQENSYHTIDSVNRELEDLGWGIDPLDDGSYDLLRSSLDSGGWEGGRFGGFGYQKVQSSRS